MIAAIEAGGTKFVLAIADAGGTVRETARISTGRPADTLTDALEFFRAAAGRHGAIATMGIASFGPIDIDHRSLDFGRFKATPKPGWAGASYCEAFAELGVPISIDSDVNCAALGEWLHGAGRGCETVAYTTVGTGIGSGVVKLGVPVQGFGHLETGHICVPRDPAIDPFEGVCPFHGDCLEGLASGPAIAKRWGVRLDSPSAERGKRISLIARYLAYLTSSLVYLHMPQKLIFGGGVLKTGGLIEAVRQQTIKVLAGYITHPFLDTGLANYIVLPALGDDAGITGAIALAMRAQRTTVI